MRKLFTILAIILTILITTIPAFGQNVTATSVLKNAYMLTNGVFNYERPIVQTNLSVGVDNLFAGFWHSAGFDGVSGPVAKLNLYGGWSKQLLSNTSLTISGAYFTLEREAINVDGNVMTLIAKIQRSIIDSTLIGYAEIQHFRPTTGESPSIGNHYKVGLGLNPWWHPWNLTTDTRVLLDDGALGFESGTLIQGSITISYAVREGFVLIGTVNWSVPVSGATDRKPSKVLGAGFKASF